MRLEEAIEHCKEKARGCGPCAADHRQLARWLKELKRLRAYARVMEKDGHKQILDCIQRIFGSEDTTK